MGRGYYSEHLGDLDSRLRAAVGNDAIERLHRRHGARHALVAGRHILLFALTAWLLFRIDNPWIWIPLAALQGFQILGFIILLHEVVHRVVGREPLGPVAHRLLAGLYALPSAISPSQFERWHLDHHRGLGSSTEDPKRAELSPKKNARWLKFLYFTPALFVIYAGAAARAAKLYDPKLRNRVRLERLFAVAVHLGVAVFLWRAGPEVLLRVYVAPLFLFFPAAFFLNRLGQHYDVDATRVEAWSTRVDGNPLLRFLFLSSNHHIEHHYFPGVPLWHLAKLNRALRPFFESAGIRNRGYASLLKGWLIDNHAPHSDWRKTSTSEPRSVDGLTGAATSQNK